MTQMEQYDYGEQDNDHFLQRDQSMASVIQPDSEIEKELMEYIRMKKE